MEQRIGVDIGGTKIAAGLFDPAGNLLKSTVVPTPADYITFIDHCGAAVGQLGITNAVSAGVGVPGAVDAKMGRAVAENIPCLSGQNLRADLSARLRLDVVMENDANCAAFSEAHGGAAEGYNTAFTLILGTGVGGGLVANGKLYQSANGYGREVGHLPFPHHTADDGPVVRCGCGQTGCVETFINGAGLKRLYESKAGQAFNTTAISENALRGDRLAMEVLDRYFTLVAKAMGNILYAFDPDIIVVTGGLSNLPGLYEAVPQRWNDYMAYKAPNTKLVPAKFGSMTGLRGAALLGKA